MEEYCRNVVRTRQSISSLSYPILVQRGIVPDLMPLTQGLETKRYPPWVYRHSKTFKEMFSYFGYFMEYLVRDAISITLYGLVDIGDEGFQDIINSIYTNYPDHADILTYHLIRVNDKNIATIDKLSDYWALTSLNFPDTNFYIPDITETEWKKSRNFFNPIIQYFSASFQNFQTGQYPVLSYNTELKYTTPDNYVLTGHPDIIGEHIVYDVKTHNKFHITPNNKTKDKAEDKIGEAFLQVLTYVAIARLMGKNIHFGSIILPMQRTILIFDVSQWDTTVFTTYLIREVKWLSEENLCRDLGELISSTVSEIDILHPTVYGSIGRFLLHERIGTHILKSPNQSMYNIIVNFVQQPDPRRNSGRAVQIFMSSGDGRCIYPGPDDIKMTRELMHNFDIKFFVHAIYSINPAFPDPNYIDTLRNDLYVCNALGGGGVVMHVAKTKRIISDEEGINRMERFIRDVIQYATETCPLLLETPAGHRGEVVTGLQEFIEFYSRFNTEERKRFKVCIDTCHIFAAGYDPVYYLEEWLKVYPGSVSLVHFNDSKKQRGQRKDKHAPPGLGYIGYTRLVDVLNLCIRENIPMVQE